MVTTLAGHTTTVVFALMCRLAKMAASVFPAPGVHQLPAPKRKCGASHWLQPFVVWHGVHAPQRICQWLNRQCACIRNGTTLAPFLSVYA